MVTDALGREWEVFAIYAETTGGLIVLDFTCSDKDDDDVGTTTITTPPRVAKALSWCLLYTRFVPVSVGVHVYGGVQLCSFTVAIKIK